MWNDFLILNAYSGDAATLRALLASGCDPNASNKLDLTPLICADFSEPDVVRALLEAGADARMCHWLGVSPLHLAVEACCYESASLLLKSGRCDVNCLDRKGRSALRIAVVAGYKDIVELLIEMGANVNETYCDESIISLAISSQNEALTMYLLQQGADVSYENENGSSVLHYAANLTSTSVAEKILSLGADANKSDHFGLTPLHVAVSAGNVAVVELLLNHGANVTARLFNGNTPLRMASSLGIWNSYETMKLLLERGAPVEDDMKLESTALYEALSSCDCKTVRLMLDHGANLKADNWRGLTALHFAAMNQRIEMVELVLERGFEINARSSFGCVPLHSATLHSSEEICYHLASAGADVNCRDKANHSALYLAVVYQRPSLVDCYLDHKADLSLRFGPGESLLAAASRRDNEKTKLILMKHIVLQDNGNMQQTILESDFELIEGTPALMAFYTVCKREMVKLNTWRSSDNVELYTILLRWKGDADGLLAALTSVEMDIRKEFPVYFLLAFNKYFAGFERQLTIVKNKYR